ADGFVRASPFGQLEVGLDDVVDIAQGDCVALSSDLRIVGIEAWRQTAAFDDGRGRCYSSPFYFVASKGDPADRVEDLNAVDPPTDGGLPEHRLEDAASRRRRDHGIGNPFGFELGSREAGHRS